VEVPRRHPRHRRAQRPEPFDGGRDGLTQLVRENDRDEGADHGRGRSKPATKARITVVAG
jgi:hypothetical protein